MQSGTVVAFRKKGTAAGIDCLLKEEPVPGGAQRTVSFGHCCWRPRLRDIVGDIYMSTAPFTLFIYGRVHSAQDGFRVRTQHAPSPCPFITALTCGRMERPRSLASLHSSPLAPDMVKQYRISPHTHATSIQRKKKRIDHRTWIYHRAKVSTV
ncbi:hypothetical protein K474DRAFT_391268 [Panus rudis PR-1116 ss-1]|nr:hypothetical protein K474DRAFT_391268 [Panus rudis PR-1116 ss-1]